MNRSQFFESYKSETLGLVPLLKPLACKNSPRYIVSLTSYGKRLNNTAPYAIITLLNQNVKPDKLILWIAHEDEENIPQIMSELIPKGLEIRFCDDIKSYKKLIFSLNAFPDDYIITADDDVYYPSDWFEKLFIEHKKNPKKIICHRAHGINIDSNHNPLPYLQWYSCINPRDYFSATSRKMQPEILFPTGVGGILYPPNCFYKDVTNKDLFTRLAPSADDIWFWAMAVMNKDYFGNESPYIVLEQGFSNYLNEIDPEQQSNGNALWNFNFVGGNDKQLKSVIEHYPAIKEYLNKILYES